MFIHNFKYAFKALFGNKILIFFTFAFPIIMSIFFNLAFSNIENSEKLDIIDIAIVDNEEWSKNEAVKEAFKTLSDKDNEDRLFETKYVLENEAKELLEDGKISGYLIFQEQKPKVVVKSSGIEETILKYVTEEIIQTAKVTEELITSKAEEQIKQGNFQIDTDKIGKEVEELIKNSDAKLTNISNKNLSYTMIEYYTLIAMTCLYGGMLGMVAINNHLPNMGSIGKRTSIAPTPKGKMIVSSLAASYVAQLIGLALLFVFTIFVLKVDYGSNLPLIILLALVGSLAGLSLRNCNSNSSQNKRKH